MHYLIIPPGSSEIAENWVRYINVKWTVVSRETMRMSADPQNIWESIVGSSVNVLRFIFNNFYYFLFIIFILICIVLYRTKWIKKSINSVKSRFKR